MRGVYLFDGNKPIRLKKIKSNTTKFLSINEYEALNKLFVENPCGENSLKCWIKKMISNKSIRLSLIDKMSEKSILPNNNVPWKVIDVKVTGNNIY